MIAVRPLKSNRFARELHFRLCHTLVLKRVGEHATEEGEGLPTSSSGRDWSFAFDSAGAIEKLLVVHHRGAEGPISFELIPESRQLAPWAPRKNGTPYACQFAEESKSKLRSRRSEVSNSF